jgi:GMP synthase-like glutamine amidotransferase
MKKIKILYLSFFEESDIIMPKKYNVTIVNIFSNDFKLNIIENNYHLLILGGGIKGIPRASNLIDYQPDIFNLLNNIKIPVLGICYGMELLYNFIYNKIPKELQERHKRENVNIKLDSRYNITSNITNMNVRFNHKYYCPEVSKGIISKLKIIDTNKNNKNKKLEIPIFIKFKKNIYGTQFHFKNKKDLTEIIDNIINNNLYQSYNL